MGDVIDFQTKKRQKESKEVLMTTHEFRLSNGTSMYVDIPDSVYSSSDLRIEAFLAFVKLSAEIAEYFFKDIS